jgi:hypothetical protein
MQPLEKLELLFRKKKAVHKTATTDDKRLQSTLKRVGVNTIPAIEEVNIFKDDLVIQFLNPKGLPVLLFCSCWFLLHVVEMGNASVTDSFVCCFLLCSCSASFHRCKHMGGQWIPTDEK